MKKPSPQLSLRLDAVLSDSQTSWCDGARLPYLGGDLMLRLSTGREAALREEASLHITLPPEATARQIRDCAEAWLRDEARQLIEAAVNRHAEHLERIPPRWSLSFARGGNWAKTDAAGALRFHWRLVEQPAAIVDQVVGRSIAALAPTSPGSDLFAELTA